MITISLCMIVKNEEKLLSRCLDSVKDLMDEIVIVDTGSTDRTREIARQYTERTYDFVWIDDFAAARNFACSKASCTYIYCADADEVLDEENREKFRQLKETLLPEVDIVQMYYANQLSFGTIYNYDKEYRPKLIKRLRTFQWVERIHETILLEPVIFDSDVTILHMPLENHAGRDLQAFRRETSGGSRLSARLHHIYAKELFISGTSEDFRLAEDFFTSSAADTDRSADEVKEAACVAARAARLRGDDLQFMKYAMKDVAEEASAEICCELGEFYFIKGDFEEAAIWFYNAVYETGCILNVHCGGDLPLRRLAECYRAMEKTELLQHYQREAEEWLDNFHKSN